MDITPTKVDNLNGDIITYVGVWTTSNTSASNGIAAKPYHTTVTAGDYLTFNFTGGSAFSVRGSKTPDHERYSVVSFSSSKEYRIEIESVVVG